MELIRAFFVFFLTLITNKYIIIIFILSVLIKILYPRFRGFMGEFWVKQELKKLPKDEYLIINDVMLKQNEVTHQIDHLVISQFGIFVIEMKNYYGLILGNDYKDKWIQYLGKNKIYFLNPIYQNYGHVKVLEEVLNLDNKAFVPIVCFSNQAKVKVEGKNNVVLLDNLISKIKEYQNITLEADIEAIYKKILELNITEKSERKKHVKNIKYRINEEKKKTNNMICPKCGNDLVIKNGKYGEFIGCSNYPKCRFIKK